MSKIVLSTSLRKVRKSWKQDGNYLWNADDMRRFAYNSYRGQLSGTGHLDGIKKRSKFRYKAWSNSLQYDEETDSVKRG